MSDADFLLHVLRDGLWHRWDTIMAVSQRERGHGLTIHSRASQLRRRGHIIECKTIRRNGRAMSTYRLVLLDSATTPVFLADPPQPVVVAESSGRQPNPDGDDAQNGCHPLHIQGQLVLEVA